MKRQRKGANGLTPMPDASKRLLQKGILPIVATASDGHLHPIGTGFVICTLGRQAIMLSAAHNFSKIARIERPYDLHHPTTPDEFRLAPSTNTVLEKTKMHALYCDNEGEHHFALIANAYSRSPWDIAVCTLHLEDHIPSTVIFEKKLAIDTTPPQTGIRIIAAGYSKMRTQCQVDYSANVATATYEKTLDWRHGYIIKVFHSNGPRNQPWPCFQCDTPFDSGMSGGPIIDTSYGDLIVACGVISSDSTSEALNMQQGSGSDALASILWPVMSLPIKNVMLDGVLTEVSLLELQRRNFIDDKGKASEHIIILPETESNEFHMIWK